MEYFTNLDTYVSTMGGRLPYPGGDRDGSAVEADGAVRNYVAEQMQRLQDNGYDVGKFFDSVSGNSKDGYGERNWYFGASKGYDNKSLGDNEMLAIAYTMMNLDQMQADGRITADQYAGYMRRLTSDDMIDSIEAHGDNSFYTMLEDISRSGENEPDTEVAAANREALAVDVRPVINDADDYYNSARNADPSRAEREGQEGYNPYSLMRDQLHQAHEDGLIDDETYEASGVVLLDRYGDVTDWSSDPDKLKEANMVLYAMEDAASLDDPEVAGKILSADGLDVIGGYEPPTGLGGVLASITIPGQLVSSAQRVSVEKARVGLLSELDKASHIERADNGKAVDNGGIDSDRKLPVDPSDRLIHDHGHVDVDDDKMTQIADTMISNYFESGEEGRISAEDYEAKRAEYEALDSNEKKQAFMTLNEDFADAHKFVRQVENLEEGVKDGRYRITETTDENGETRYGVESTQEPLFIMKDRFREVTDRDRYVVPGSDGNAVYMNQIYEKSPLVDRIQGKTGDAVRFPGSLMEKVQIMAFNNGEFSDAFNQAMGEVNGGDPQVDHDGKDGDYDYGAAEIDLSVLQEKSPAEKFEDMRSAAEACWRGDYGDGNARTEALQAAGYSAEDCRQIQSMVNLGQEWCQNATPEDFDKEFPSEDGKTLAEKEAEFQTARSEAAAQLMTFEGHEDFLEQYNAMAGEDGQLTAEEAENLYDAAAHALDDTFEQGAPEGLGGTMEEGGLSEAVSNLAEYAEEHPDDGFSGSYPDVTEPEGGEEHKSGDYEYGMA